MLKQKDREKQIGKLAAHAVKKYGELRKRKVRPPLEQLLLSIFCQYASVRRATRALRQLKRNFVDWNEVRISSAGEVASVLSGAQWAVLSAERVKNVLADVFHTRNEVSLAPLAYLSPSQARAYLQSLPTVNRELADEVLMLSLRVPIFPCSADTVRMCHRLGLLPDARPTLKNQKILTEMFEPPLIPALHRLFCDSASTICRPEEPLCNKCIIARTCPSCSKGKD